MAQKEAFIRILTGPSESLLSSLRHYLTAVVSDPQSSVARQVLLDFLALPQLAQLESQSDILKLCLELCQSRSVLFEEQISIICERLATIFEEEEEWSEAARLLQQIPLESGHRTVPLQYKLQIYNRITRLYLEDHDSVTADTYMNRMGLIIHECDDKAIQLQYKASQARLLDFKRQFLQAATKFHELSYIPDIHESEREMALSQSVTCAILAASGPQKSRILAALFKDERVRNLSGTSTNFHILERMFLERILEKKDILEFSKTLQPHQLATLSDGSTVLDRAVTEHNIVSASRIYSNIRVSELAELLGIEPIKAEKIVATMIGEGRLSGTIDQVDEFVYFEPMHEVHRWDEEISSYCFQLEDIIKNINSRYPDWQATKAM